MTKPNTRFEKHQTEGGDPRATTLSRREIEIAYWISNGKSDWEISQILEISPKTVNFHIENVKKKYAVHTRMQAIVAVVKDGLI